MPILTSNNTYVAVIETRADRYGNLALQVGTFNSESDFQSNVPPVSITMVGIQGPISGAVGTDLAQLLTDLYPYLQGLTTPILDPSALVNATQVAAVPAVQGGASMATPAPVPATLWGGSTIVS